MGAGILPITIHKGKILFLFSREFIGENCKKGRKFTDNGKWSDFGGGSHTGETIKDTAIREGWEESGGFLGNIQSIRDLVENKCVAKIEYGGYSTYVVFIKYDKTLPMRFSEDFLDVFKKSPEKLCKNGLYEKDLLDWLEYNEIASNYGAFRPFYKNIIDRILVEFKNFNYMRLV